jgi:OmpA-OmpF porin, OOP family
MRLRFVWLPLLLAGYLQAQSIDLQAELMNQIGTDTSRKGDLISARVLMPAQFQGDIIEGKINESQSGAKLGGKSSFSFSFTNLRHGGAAIPIKSQLKSVVNSKGKTDVDEEGRMVRRGTGNIAKAAGGTGAGALVGGIVGGGKGAAIGAVVGAAASIALIEMAADAPNIRFSPGTRFTIETAAREGASLATLGANQPARAEVSSRSTASAPPVAASSPVQPAAQAQMAEAQAPASSAGSQQPELTTLKSTFIPGEKTIFYDDFTDMGPDDAPPHFKIRGAAPELRASGNVRQLTVTQRGSIFPNVTSLPKNFTFEADLMAEAPNRAIMILILLSKEKQIFQLSTTAALGYTDLVASMRAPYSELGRKRFPTNWTEPVKLALWVQNGRLRVFVNGEKQLDFNQVEMPPIDKVEFAHDFYGGKSIGYRTVRFAESTPDFSQMISSAGRYVTHGILFDTDSDRLKPESAPVIQGIARGIETNPNLKILIEGHTDSVGNAAHNMDLSKRRAEAVKSVLVNQFNIDAGRLSTAGLGATKPIDSNDTPQGRSQNRRVELVKQ